MADTNIYSEHCWFEDFPTGSSFEFGQWEMKREDMLAYARMYDPELFHTDEDEAKRLGWGALIASGPQVASICRRLQKDGFPNAEIVISPGWDGIKWFKPVYAGDVLSCRAEVLEAKPLGSRPGEGLIKLDNRVVQQDGEMVAQVVTNWFMRTQPT